MNLEILYEDNHLIVTVKPKGILSQKDITGDIDMTTLIKYYLKDRYQKKGNVYLGLVHRLDRMTEGIMVFAKTSKAAARLSKQISEKTFVKKYYAVVNGILENDGRLTNYIIKDEKDGKSYIGNEKSGKLAVLDYHILKRFANQTLVDVTLLTGRHHQIRVQFANINHCLVGDYLYGNFKNQGDLMLYSYYIAFYHPITQELMTFNKIPNNNQWKKYFE